MRHAAVLNPTDMVYSNLAGFPLSEAGRKQAREAADWLRTTPLTRIFTSGRERARETAAIVAGLNSGCPAIEIDEDLRDMGLGEYSNRIRFDDWKAHRNEYWEKQLRGEGGMESPVQVQQRMMRAWHRIVTDYPTGNILIVSHAGPITTLLSGLETKGLESRHEVDYHIGKANIVEVELGASVRIRRVFEPGMGIKQ